MDMRGRSLGQGGAAGVESRSPQGTDAGLGPWWPRPWGEPVWARLRLTPVAPRVSPGVVGGRRGQGAGGEAARGLYVTSSPSCPTDVEPLCGCDHGQF